MNRPTLLCCGVMGIVLAFLLATGVSASLAAEPPSPPVLAGVIAGPGGEKAADALGRQGCLLIRSAQRWADVRKQLQGLGWQPPEADPLAGIDFDRQMIACVLHYGNEGDKFAVRRVTQEGGRTEAEIVMSYIIYKKRGTLVNDFKFFAVALPRAADARVSVLTYHPMNGGPYPTPEKARLEWTVDFGPTAGDVVDGLCGRIRAEKPAVKAGEDIGIEFRLDFFRGEPEGFKGGMFAYAPASCFVWDGKYSNGYRNHAFEVTTPDGKTHLLRRPVQDAWDKNIPHLIDVAAGKPYVLPEWVEGKTFKSLKSLGLDTSQPGKYVITGIYMEAGGPHTERGKTVSVWGGTIATNTVTVEVTKE